MTNQELTDFFTTHEWFDNSKIRIIRGCKRKAFYSLIGPKGVKLSATVGDGANFGSSMHAALARYYNTWGKASEPTRRVFAARAFTEEWSKYFPGEHTQTKHQLRRGLEILNAYCDNYILEDSLFEPVEAELGFAVDIKPAVGGPFHYVGRIDGIFKRISDNTFWLRETKTTGSMAEKRLAQLKFDHQPLGYVSCIRELQPEFKISGFLGDIILIAAQKLEFARDYFPVTQRDCDSWKQQLINTVTDWRRMSVEGGLDRLNTFYQDTERCFDYGKCAFYELCDYGINDESLALFEPNTWHPLIQRTPENVIIK